MPKKSHVNFVPDIFQLIEEDAQGHSIIQCFLTALLNHRAVGHRIGKRNADFSQINPLSLQFAQHFSGVFQRGKSGSEIDGENVVLFLLKKLL